MEWNYKNINELYAPMELGERYFILIGLDRH